MQCGIDVTAAYSATSGTEWFDSTLPLKLFECFPHKNAMVIRKRWIRGFIKPGGCNYYLAIANGNKIFGILGFSIPDYGDYDLLLKADTTPSSYTNSTDLLLYALRSKQVKESLEKNFNRDINNCYTMVFSQHKNISRYRKHAKQIRRIDIRQDGEIVGYNIGYLFELGTIPSLKSAKAQWMQKNGN